MVIYMKRILTSLSDGTVIFAFGLTTLVTFSFLYKNSSSSSTTDGLLLLGCGRWLNKLPSDLGTMLSDDNFLVSLDSFTEKIFYNITLVLRFKFLENMF